VQEVGKDLPTISALQTVELRDAALAVLIDLSFTDPGYEDIQVPSDESAVILTGHLVAENDSSGCWKRFGVNTLRGSSPKKQTVALKAWVIERPAIEHDLNGYRLRYDRTLRVIAAAAGNRKCQESCVPSLHAASEVGDTSASISRRAQVRVK
jgi:hypothetical protein